MQLKLHMVVQQSKTRMLQSMPLTCELCHCIISFKRVTFTASSLQYTGFTLLVTQLRVKTVTVTCAVMQALDQTNTFARQHREALTESCPVFSTRQWPLSKNMTVLILCKVIWNDYSSKTHILSSHGFSYTETPLKMRVILANFCMCLRNNNSPQQFPGDQSRIANGNFVSSKLVILI